MWFKMTLTPSDVESLTTALTRWEYAEYASGGLVAVACAGEYIASFKPWFTGGDKARKERLEKRSTLLLIVALAAELICLVKTNQISGQVIGALDVRATEAYRKAGDAVVNSEVAIGKSGDAINKSEIAAGRVEVIGNDITSLKTRATEVSAELAEALRRATDAEEEAGRLKARFADRTLTDSQVHEIEDEIRPFVGQEFGIVTYWDTPECTAI
ncbi:MAG: hypothetical protein ABSC93_17800, partial [Bryobacteraceae bacterium]